MKCKFILLLALFTLYSSFILAQSGNASDNTNGSGSTISGMTNMYTNQSDNTNGSSTTVNSMGDLISDEASSKNHGKSNQSDNTNGSSSKKNLEQNGYVNAPGVNGVAKLNSLLNIFESKIFIKN